MLSIENLTCPQKPRMMEVLWDDLSHGSETRSLSEWHTLALNEAELFVAENQAGFVSWDAAKKTLRASDKRRFDYAGS